jgi:hypothetical protein
MRKLIVPLVLAAVTASGPALAAGTSAPLKQQRSKATAARTAAPAPTAAKSSSVKRSGTLAKAAKKPPVVTAAPPSSNVVPGCEGSLGIFGTAAAGCAGFFSGNLLNGSPTDLAAQDAALAGLGFDFSGDLSTYTKIETSDATFLDFGQELFGNTIIGIHFGNGSGVGNSTGFFEFDFTSPVNGIALNIPGSSGVVLYQTGASSVGAVPEPSTWAMMLMGFGAVGYSMRRRKRLVAQLA